MGIEDWIKEKKKTVGKDRVRKRKQKIAQRERERREKGEKRKKRLHGVEEEIERKMF